LNYTQHGCDTLPNQSGGRKQNMSGTESKIS